MNDTRSTLRYPGFRFPAEIIGYAVWLYHRFTLSFRDIEDLLAERGIIVTHETIRQWCLRFGQEYANSIRRRRPQPGDKWHLERIPIRQNHILRCGSNLDIRWEESHRGRCRCLPKGRRRFGGPFSATCF